jgi:hypothetical protein
VLKGAISELAALKDRFLKRTVDEGTILKNDLASRAVSEDHPPKDLIDMFGVRIKRDLQTNTPV